MGPAPALGRERFRIAVLGCELGATGAARRRIWHDKDVCGKR